MRSSIASICNFVLEYSFYALILTVPFAFTDKTFELFEFNKMWLLFGYTIVIAAAWFCKMIAQQKVFIQKTPLDIPIALFFLAHIVSTLFSMDQHLSIWGYYSRFNGGLLSMISYILLYYAFVSNVSFAKKDEATIPEEIHKLDGQKLTKRALVSSLVASTLVALWGLPAHFGYDPTCLMFRGTLDVSCWTADFQPKIRIFSTLGQPNWLATYLAILLPLALAFGWNKWELHGKNITKHTKDFILMLIYFAIALLFYVDIIYTDSQSGFLGTIAAIGTFSVGYILISQKSSHLKNSFKYIAGMLFLFLFIAFFVGVPVVQLKQFTWANIQTKFTQTTTPPVAKPTPVKPSGSALEGGGGTDSGTIRKYVWQGAIEAWKANPLFGTGVETFAFAYYKYRPVGHNMTSEWDFLYNKAHNEYLNYLATTGAFGLLSYLAMIILFLMVTFRRIVTKDETLPRSHAIIMLGLASGYISMLISNFFGFSVVLGNFYLFLIPAFVFILGHMLIPQRSVLGKTLVASPPETKKHASQGMGVYQITGMIIVICIAAYQLILLTTFWVADTSYALANNLDRIGEYNQGYKEIRSAIALRGDEPTFKEELANSDATIAVALIGQKQNEPGTQLAKEAIATIDQLVAEYPNNINFLKSQVRVYYTLSQLNPAYMQQALQAMEKAHALAPTDAKIAYNLGVLYGQTGQTQKGIEVLQQTAKLKPDYKETYFALGLFYRDLAIAPGSTEGGKSGTVVNPAMQQKAVDQMNYILTNFSPDDKPVHDTLKSWGVEK